MERTIPAMPYSRYADDIVLTLLESDRATCEEVFQTVRRAVTSVGFRVNRTKSGIQGPGCRKVVTGLVINDVRPHLPRQVTDEIELAIYYIARFGLISHARRRGSRTPTGYVNRIVGLAYFARSIEPTFGISALARLKAVLEPYKEVFEIVKNSSLPSGNPYIFD
jgi:RNA-directed DNA polymerase